MTRTHPSAGPITVLESGDPALLAVAKSLLEAAKIQYFVKGEGVQDLFAAGPGYPTKRCLTFGCT
jgi:hypothetical protein